MGSPICLSTEWELLNMSTSLARTAGPILEPVSLVEARDHCEIPASDTTQDTKLIRFIKGAREQVEHDTQRSIISQTFTLSMDLFCGSSFRLPIRPVSSITSITYYDSANTQQTLSTSVYGLDAQRSIIYLKHDQDWPSVTEQHNGIVTTFVAGYGATEASVPRYFKQAILLQVTKWFVHRGDEAQVHGASSYDDAYDRLIRRILRSSYP